MSTKECPSCMADVPSAALRCKHCFHDFTVQVSRRPGPMIMLWSLAIMSLLGAGIMAYIVHTSMSVRYVIEPTQQEIQVTRTTLTGGTETSKIPFDEVTEVEYIEGGESAYYEVIAMTKDDERLLLRASEIALHGWANTVTMVIDENTDHTVELKKTLQRSEKE